MTARPIFPSTAHTPAHVTLFVDDELAESFCVIPSSTPAKPSAAAAALEQENAVLKAELEAVRARLAASEKAMKIRMEHDRELMDSIVMAKREVPVNSTACMFD